MGKDPAFLFYPGDYLRDTQTLSTNAQVAYDRIMCEHMRNICITQQQLKFFTKRLSDDEKEELLYVLDEIDGCFQIKWVAESIHKRLKYSESRRNNRKGKSKKTYDNTSLSYDKHMENENENVIEDEKEKEIESEIENEIDFSEILKIFNSMDHNFPKVKIMSKKRKANIRARIKESNNHTFGEVLTKASESKFLNGSNQQGWVASFDWIINKSNYVKILEGNYENREVQQQQYGRKKSNTRDFIEEFKNISKRNRGY